MRLAGSSATDGNNSGAKLAQVVQTKLSRRLFLRGIAAAAAENYLSRIPIAKSATAGSGVIAGAIRWDAWYSNSGPAREAQDTIGWAPWQSRAPWFAKVDSPNHVTAVGTQADMDAECEYAAAAGLKYWAFVMYSPTSPMSVGWQLYQSSANRNLVNWCGIITPGTLLNSPFSKAASWQSSIDKWVIYFKQSNYQTVEGNRPLLYILWRDGDVNGYLEKDVHNFGIVINYLRTQCKAAGVGDPYVVIMDGIARMSATIMVKVGADAIGNYIPNMGVPGVATPWSTLDNRTRAFWTSLANQGVDCIPIATTGWDDRARRMHPESFAKVAPKETIDHYFVLPTNEELLVHLKAAVSFVKENPNTCRSKALLIYSWDECDEGGNPMVPTLGRPPAVSLLNAIRGAFLRP